MVMSKKHGLKTWSKKYAINSIPSIFFFFSVLRFVQCVERDKERDCMHVLVRTYRTGVKIYNKYYVITLEYDETKKR